MAWRKVSQLVTSTRSGILNILSENNGRDIIQKCSEEPSIMSKVETRQNPVNSRLLQDLNIDMLVYIMYFLDGADACNYRASCKLLQYTFHFAGDRFWQFQLSSKLGANYSSSNSHIKFYAQYLLYNSCQLEHEYHHARSLAHCYHALSVYCSHTQNSHGVYGMVCDLFWADSEEVAKTLSRERYWALPTIIVDTEQRVYEFKKITNAHVRNGPASFLPLSMASKNYQEAARDYRFNDAASGNMLQVPGFLGYAVNLLRMRPEHEYLKLTVLPMLFKNLMVFETAQAKFDYESSLDPIFADVFRGVALDEATEQPTLQQVYPCFKWKSPRPSYFKNYRFTTRPVSTQSPLLSTEGITAAVCSDSPVRPLKICTHSCSSSHNDCVCRSRPEPQPEHRTVSSLLSRSFSASPPALAATAAPQQQSTPSATSTLLSVYQSSTSVLKQSFDKMGLSFAPSSLHSTSFNGPLGDCSYIAAVIEDLENRMHRAKASYTVVRYSY